MIGKMMDSDAIFKALANPVRRKILQCLKNPEDYFPEQSQNGFAQGVCAGQFEKACDVSQSTMSNHLAILQQAGLVTVQKHGQWSYFSRDDALIQQYIEYLKHTL